MRKLAVTFAVLGACAVAVLSAVPADHRRQAINIAAAAVLKVAPDGVVARQPALRETLDQIGWQTGNPVFIRIFKSESELELFGLHEGAWKLLKTYAICNWSGELGPKHREGDGQSPEGFYVVGARQLNPNSSYHLSFNLGFPNAVEAAQGRTGSYLMVHGNCVSIGCYAMTDAGIEEIYGIVEEALKAGVSGVAVHAFPFRMTEEAMEEQKDHPELAFWQTLKPGYQHFEDNGAPPRVLACADTYRISEEGADVPEGCKALKAW